MKKLFLIAMTLILGVSVMAQQKIQLRSADKAECVKSDMRSLKASFSFSSIDAQDYESERGTFSWLSLPNTVIGGNEGDPQIPVVNELIAVPFGANPSIEITSYTTTDYRLEDYGIHTLVPRQPSLRKDQRPEEVPFVYNEAAYQSTRGLRSAPQAVVSVEGTMRGIQLGKMTIEPVSYDPINNTLRVFNNIEVEVHFDGADAAATKQMLIDTYSPYFDVVYAQMFNGRSLRDAYSDYPDLYTTPVKMIVITTATYAKNQVFQNWVNWKKQKGIYTTVYTTATTGTTAANIKSFLRNIYCTDAPTFVVIVGDTGDVTYSLSSSTTSKVTDLYYSTTSDSDIYPDVFLSRMPVSSATELENLLNKIMTYEQYTMADPSYLSKVLLIAGSDGTWNPRVGQPTINYAADNYFNTAHGFTNVYKYLTDYTNCYSNMNTGIGFANYTAHGGETGWSGPSFSVSDANNLTNNDKYFWAMGNCCLAANWGYSSTCLAEALLRGANKGAFGYIGSCPETYWWEDYYFGVGATTVTNATPSMSQTQTGSYDGMFMDDMYNTLNSVPYLGNVAVTYAHANSYQSSVTDTYYWEAYHTLGDGSVMPYHVNPSANNVSHAPTIGIGLNTFTVNADAGSYVSITKDNEILGVAQVDATGIANVPITPVTSAGDVLIVVTRQQRQPYMQTIPAVSLNGPYISLDSYTPTSTHVGDATNLSLTFKNVGADATVGNTNITLSSNDPSVVTVLQPTGSFGVLAPEATTTVNGFSFKIAEGVADGTIVTLHYSAVNGGNTYEGNIAITATEAVLEYQNMAWNGGFVPGETLTLSATFKNTGHYQATNARIELTSSSDYITINTQPISAGTIEAGQEVTYDFSVTIDANCPETAVLPVTFTMTADGGLTATGTENLKNSCMLYFELADSYGDGWNGSNLIVSFDDGTESQTLTIPSGGSSASYTIEVGNGVHVTLTWSSGSQWDKECSFTVSYEGDLVIYQLLPNVSPSSGVLYEFDCNCAAASLTFTVSVSANPEEGGTVTVGSRGHRAQLVYDFENGWQGWTAFKGTEGTSPHNWMHNTEYTAYDSEGDLIVPVCHNSSDGMMLSESYISASTSGGGDAQAVYPDNYLVSPQIELGGSFTFYVASRMSNYPAEKFSVLVSESGNTSPTEFTHTELTVTLSDNEWHTYTIDLSNYSGMGYVAIRHYDCYDQHLLYIDDVTIVEGGDTPAPNATSAIFNYGESCTVTATPAEGYYFEGWLQDGEVVEGAGASYTFYVTSDVNLVATFAEGLMIGDGGSTTDEYLPSHSYYNYTLSQQIYTVEELGSAGLINSIAFFNGGSTKTRSYDVYMVSTTKSTFSGATDWVTVTSDNLVYSGSVEMTANDWTTIEFSTPFLYDGVSNVVLVVDDNTGTYSQGMLCRVFNAPSQALRVYSDGTNYNPFAPSSYSGTVMDVKNQLMVTKVGLDGCVNTAPSSVEVSDVTGNSATVNWTGFSESYNVMLGIPTTAILVDEDFAEGIPSDWANSSNYPWSVVDGHMESGNAGVASSTSSISTTVTFLADGTVEFDAECMGEGTSTYWDHCDFYIDEERMVYAGANVSGWNHYSFEVAAGEHTFTWSYTKDSSVNPEGDYFAVDNVVMKSVAITWNEPVAVEETEYVFTGLSPETDYCVKVQGICDDIESTWSGIAFFATTEITTITQTIELAAGVNWVSFNVEITLDELKAALVAALPNTTISIQSKTQNTNYNPNNHRWTGQLRDLDLSQSYRIIVPENCEAVLVGEPVDSSEHPITVNPGINWITFPFAEDMTVANAFAGFANRGDALQSKNQNASYNGTRWNGQLRTLEPGQGYIYNSAATETRTFTFPTSTSKSGQKTKE